MSNITKLNELMKRRTEIEGAGEGSTNNQSNARGRINLLFDEKSFVELGSFVTHRNTDFNMSNKFIPADGIVVGYGTIEGRLVYAYSQDSTTLGGALGEMHAKKICQIYDLALKMGAPVVGLVDTAGLRLQESTDALNGFGEIFLKQTIASGVIPQITAILGNCCGGSSFIPALSDFSFMIAKNSKLFVNSPNTLESKTASFESIASAKYHSENSGMVDFVYETENEVFGGIRSLISVLPANNLEAAAYNTCTDDLNRVSLELNELEVASGVDARSIIMSVADNSNLLEVKKEYAKTIITGFIKLNGGTVGVIANQTLDTDGTLTSKACKKASKFINICDSFNIPILSFTDVTGFNAVIKEEEEISKAVSSMIYAFANATVPKVNVLLNRCYGSAYVAMNSKHIGADFVYAWPSAKISMMDANSAVRIMYADEIKASKKADELIEEKTSEYENLQSSPYAAASRGYIDDIIEPASTRKRVIAAIEMLSTKRENRPDKKHGTV